MYHFSEDPLKNFQPSITDINGNGIFPLCSVSFGSYFMFTSYFCVIFQIVEAFYVRLTLSCEEQQV